MFEILKNNNTFAGSFSMSLFLYTFNNSQYVHKTV